MPNIEEQLRKAIEEGKFDDLPGKGKPLRLDDTSPHVDPEWELAYHMLKEAGYTLPWIETIREIEQDLEATRTDLQLAWKVHRIGYAQLSTDNPPSTDWERSQFAFKEKLISLNKRIRDYNLQVPNARFQRPILNYERELEKISG